MTGAIRRPRLWRLGTVVPAVMSAVAGLAVAGVISSHPTTSTRPVSFADRSPIGKVSTIYQRPGGVHVSGWDFDPDAPKAALRTYASVDGKWINTTTAKVSRSDVKKAHPNAGAAHGFSWNVPVPEGRHAVCVAAQNRGKGKNIRLGCVTKTFDYGPFGALAVGTAPGSLRIFGWTLDSDNVKAAVRTTIKVDNTTHAVTANRSHAGVANIRKGAGSLHGFDQTYRVAQGRHTVCVTATNIGHGTNNSIGCKTITLNESPRAKVVSVWQSSGKLRLTGWAFDPDARTSALGVTITIDGVAHSITASRQRGDVAKLYPTAGRSHGFDQSYAVTEKTHKVCVTARNVSYGSNLAIACRNVVISFTPSAALTALTATSTGAKLTGWTSDPDTSAPISARITVDGKTAQTVVAKAKGSAHSGHNLSVSLPLTSGKHTICITGLNVGYGKSNSKASCQAITLALKPIGKFEKVARAKGSNNLTLTGWTLDPDTKSPISVVVTLDGKTGATLRAATTRSDVARSYPASGAAHGISSTIAASSGEHTVCLTAKNVGAGANVSLGCRVINAVHPVTPSAPRTIKATPGYGAATITWVAPASDGGAPWSKFVITASPGGKAVTVGATTRSVTVTGLKAKAAYTFTVRAANVAGYSAAGKSAKITTQSGPPPQRTPAPVSTSRYIRNIRGSSTAELATMRREGAADAKSNPSGHSYLVLLDIGGQDQSDGGVVLSATTRFVTYGNLVKDIQAYLDGYHGAQKSTAPVTIAIGTNNDMEVTSTSGKAWANSVVDPIVSYAKRYSGIRIAGANDIEPGFRAGYTQTKSWLAGYLSATSAPFIFNGSADGCAWTVTNRGCNNGWSMAGLYYLAAGAAPTRSVNLPQIYNNTMADQWKFISLTGIGQGKARINFGGTLTEWTACDQSGGCGSLTGRNAWARMWANLQSDARLKVSSLPYATDLRIDK